MSNPPQHGSVQDGSAASHENYDVFGSDLTTHFSAGRGCGTGSRLIRIATQPYNAAGKQAHVAQMSGYVKIKCTTVASAEFLS